MSSLISKEFDEVELTLFNKVYKKPCYSFGMAFKTYFVQLCFKEWHYLGITNFQ